MTVPLSPQIQGISFPIRTEPLHLPFQFCSISAAKRALIPLSLSQVLIGCLQIFMEEFGLVKGHFGPINTVAFHPDGNGFVTGTHSYLQYKRFIFHSELHAHAS